MFGLPDAETKKAVRAMRRAARAGHTRSEGAIRQRWRDYLIVPLGTLHLHFDAAGNFHVQVLF